jgi:hypothetical protein
MLYPPLTEMLIYVDIQKFATLAAPAAAEPSLPGGVHATRRNDLVLALAGRHAR